MKKLFSLFRTAYVCKNWMSALSVKFGLAKKHLIKFRNGYTFLVEPQTWSEFQSRVNLFWEFPLATVVNEEFIKVPVMGRELNFYFGKSGTHILKEVFKDEAYKPKDFDITNRTVVDIGCSYGDSLIYFAWLGAKEVYGFEPQPNLHALAEKNIAVNKVHSVHLIRAAVGGKHGSLFKDSTYYNTEVFEFNKDFTYTDKTEDIPLITLEDIVRDYRIERAFMKMDCEGYEYDILLNASDEVLSHFDYIVLEYHYGYKKLEKRLKAAGFKVWHSTPVKSEFELEGHDKGVGDLVAKRA